jgi:hypothetical protein
MLQLRKEDTHFNLPCLALTGLALVWFMSGASLLCIVEAQNHSSARATVAGANANDQTKGEDDPLFSEYKGVRIGMTTDEARKKLGEPQDKSDEQDFFVFNEKESAQVFYDKAHKTYAISINYLGGGTATPAPKGVLGSEIEAKPDGSLYKMVRYRKAGYWVSYSRTGGTDPLTTVTIQRID